MEIKYINRENCELYSDNLLTCQNNWQEIKRINDLATGLTFKIIYCNQCKIGFTNPYPTEDTVDILYNDRSSPFNFDPIRGSVIDRMKDYFGIKLLKKIIPNHERNQLKRVLDFGTGNGRFALLSKQIFSNAIIDAVDYQENIPLAFMNRNSKDLNYLQVKHFQEVAYKYDLIILRHVLEHNHHPAQLITLLKNKLSDKGIIYVEVPNVNSWYCRKASGVMNSYSVPYHIFHFSKESLKILLNSCGLDCDINFAEMPLMGGVVAAILRKPTTLLTQILGVLLNPLQIVLAIVYEPPCLAAICRKKTERSEESG